MDELPRAGEVVGRDIQGGYIRLVVIAGAEGRRDKCKERKSKNCFHITRFCLFLTLFLRTGFAAVRWRNVASIYPGISAGDNSYTCEISCLSGTTKIDCTLVLYEKGLFGTYSEVSRSSSTYYGHTHEFSGTANIKSGTTYKLVTTATVTRNGSSETVSNTFEKKC